MERDGNIPVHSLSFCKVPYEKAQFEVGGGV